jgi:hypothetical protein
MTKISLLSFLLFISVNMLAQNKKGYTKDADFDYKVIKMPRFTIADFPKKTTPISNIEIIQNLRDSVRLGFVFKGLGNQAAEIISKTNLTSFLQEHITKMYGDDYKPTGVKMLWVLKNLRIGEKEGPFAEYSYLKFKADSYVSKDAVNYKLVTSIDTVFVSSSGADVTAWHGVEIEDAFKLLLKRTLKNVSEPLFVGNDFYTYAQIREKEIAIPVIPPIQSTSKYEEGGYANFKEFLENRPSIKNFLLQVQNENRIFCFAPNKLDTIKLWGLCRQGEIYVYAQETLIPLEPFGNGFMISDYIKNVNKRNNRNFLIGYMGGMIGVAIMRSQQEFNHYLVTSIPYIKKSKKYPEASCIDMETGELSF